MTEARLLSHLPADPVLLAICRHLRHHHQGLTGRELAALVGASTFKVQGVLHWLIERRLVTVTPVGMAHLHRLNLEHLYVRNALIPLLDYNEEMLQEIGNRVMKHARPKPLAVILYGSAARGEDTPTSDIDLCLVFTDAVLDGATPIRGEDAVYAWSLNATGRPLMFMHASPRMFIGRDRSHLLDRIIKEGRSIAGLDLVEVLSHERA